jgi:hypothetical protein
MSEPRGFRLACCELYAYPCVAKVAATQEDLYDIFAVGEDGQLFPRVGCPVEFQRRSQLHAVLCRSTSAGVAFPAHPLAPRPNRRDPGSKGSVAPRIIGDRAK